MAFWTYILKCADGLYYTGHTDDLDLRLAQHQSGHFRGFTSVRLPVTLCWATDFPTRYEALDAELRIKKWSRAKKEALMRGDWAAVSHYAKPPIERPRVSTTRDTNGNDNAPSIPLASSEACPEPVEAVEMPLSNLHEGAE